MHLSIIFMTAPHVAWTRTSFVNERHELDSHVLEDVQPKIPKPQYASSNHERMTKTM